MEWQLAASIILSALGLIAALLKMHNQAVNFALPNLANKIIGAIKEHDAEAERRSRKHRKQIRKLVKTKKAKEDAVIGRLFDLEQSVLEIASENGIPKKTPRKRRPKDGDC